MKILQTVFLMLLLAIAFKAEAGRFGKLPNYYPAQVVAALESPSVSNEELKALLQKLLAQGHTSLGYDKARRILFGEIHLDKDSQGVYIKDVYCRKIFRSSSGVGENQIPNGNQINCEHTWPQSKFTSSHSKDMQKSDLHHLYPTDNRANSTRGNHPFADVDGSTLDYGCESSRVGSPSQSHEASSIYFEPPTEHKGNVARALFYFSVRYQIAIDQIQESHLRRWHEEDPVDAEEIERNDIVQRVQGNRNPFIDAPEVVSQIRDF